MDVNELGSSIDDMKPAQEEILELCADWTSSAWDEVDWSRIKDMSIRDILDKRRAAAATAQGAHCLQCPNFVKHVSLCPPMTRTTADVRLVWDAARRVDYQGEHCTAPSAHVGPELAVAARLRATYPSLERSGVYR